MKIVLGERRRIPLMVKQHSGNDLVATSNKPLPEPVLVQIYVIVRYY